MKISKPVDDFVVRMRELFTGDATPEFQKEEPFRLELFSHDQMQLHGAQVAHAHVVTGGHPPDKVLPRLDDNETVIAKVYDLLNDSANSKQPIAPASEWFLDNYYLVKEQIALGRTHLPKGYSETLPILAKGRSAGFPRVYDIALELIAHSDGHISIATLTAFIESYQTVTQLTLGELWAIPIMLRLAIIENIRRIASRVALDRLDKNVAVYWSEQLIESAQKKPRDIIIIIADMARSRLRLDSAFVAEFIRRLQGRGQGLSLPLTWLEERLAETGSSSVELVNIENQKQATDQVSIRNSIESIRLIRSTDWRSFVEEVSIVEKILSTDASGIYSQMDFITRDRYRHVVEWVGKNSTLQEFQVAQMAIDLTKESARNNEPVRQHHVGYFLVDEKGQHVLIKKSGMRITVRHRFKNLLRYNRLLSYAGSALLLTLLLSVWAGFYVYQRVPGIYQAIAFSLVCFVALSQAIIILTNWIATLIIKPRPLPKMDYSEGIPESECTLVAVPSMLSSEKAIEELADALEVRYLSNPEEYLYFALLTDFTDAPEEKMPEDDALLTYAVKRIEALNHRYVKESAGRSRFFLFHRPRKWNTCERVWMGQERKRGKLAELNSFLRNTGHYDFMKIAGNTTGLKQVRYVITLDADTQLPREAAWKLVATMAHPLNKPVLNTHKTRVIDGYGILQPRTSVSIPGSDSSYYARMHSSDSGLDPYTRLVSDVYQDLFSEGSFVGKGIYDIDVFEKVLGDTFPPNRILSHDLLEGSYVRSGLLTDVELFEEYPETYWADVSRRHRWIRGDWQIASWGTPFVPGRENKVRKNFISSLSRWKIWDNIRRSLVAPAAIAFLVLGWALLPDARLWTLLLLIAWLLPLMATTIWQLFHKPESMHWRAHFSETKDHIFSGLTHILFGIICLPFEAAKNLDAIFRANWRMLISHRRLLQWTPSGASNGKQKNLIQAYRYMWASVVLPAGIIMLLAVLNPAALWLAAPLLAAWVLAPAVAWRISSPSYQKIIALSSKNIDLLHCYARKTWAYFEDFVTQEDNWLAPDNYQEHPVESLAHRTSPTNIGLALLSNLAAYDFGYLSVNKLAEQTHNTFETLAALERYKGHFYNWYDTVSLVPLHPKYVSTVDSGNFIAGMILLREGLDEIRQEKLFKEQHANGLLDTFSVLKGLIDKKALPEQAGLLDKTINGLKAAYPHTLQELLFRLNTLQEQTAAFKNNPAIAGNAEALNWAGRLELQLADLVTCTRTFCPWAAYLPVPDRFSRLQILQEIPSLNNILELQRVLPVHINEYLAATSHNDEKELLLHLLKSLETGASAATGFLAGIEKMKHRCADFAAADYDFLYNKKQNLFHIGYNVSEDAADKSYYDMLASEARIGIYTAIAQGKIPQAAWFTLGRLVTNLGNSPVLLSWSGSMFEYLMPQLLMPVYENTLLERSTKGAVRNQIYYGNKNNVPWGISESGYNLVDTSLHYQYQSFGIPGLGLKRGLANDLVIAPYATMMALMVAPAEALENLKTLSSKGFEGRYGFYEAIDYTPSRMPRGQSFAVIKSFMVHHQGMSFLSLAYLLQNRKMHDRFTRDPQFQSALLLLQEKAPRSTNFYSHTEDESARQTISHESHMRVLNTPNTPIPEIQLLSNGRYSLAITNSGGGYSRWKGVALNRWREDTTRDNWGIFCYIKDLGTGHFWSNTYQPTLRKSKSYETVFSQGHVVFRRVDDGFETKTDMVISPEDDVEIRRIRITNRSATSKTIEVTSFGEVVLTDQAADEAHPAFSNLFVQTEIDTEADAILCSRRPRARQENPPWMFHTLMLHGASSESVSYETDRMRFIGRGQSIATPAALLQQEPLSGTQGSVLDPVMAIRHRIILKARQTVTVDLVVGIGESETICRALLIKYRDRYIKNRVFELAWTHSQVLLRQINATEVEAQLFNAIAGSIIYANNSFRATPSVIESNLKGQSGLWSYAISGDLPIVLVRVKDSNNIDLVKQLIKAHSYWSLKALRVDLVIWNDDFGSYRQVFHDQVIGFITATSGGVLDQPGGIFVRAGDQISNEDRILFQTVARVIFDDDKGTLAEQVLKKRTPKGLPEPLPVQPSSIKTLPEQSLTLPDHLRFNNGTGGFTEDGKEYIQISGQQKKSPVPWCNIIANKEIGSMLSESGSAYTWVDNAQAFRLTPWQNDPVSDRCSEAWYIRDEETGSYWSPTPLPAAGKNAYITRHGFGYSVYEHIHQGVFSELWVYVDKDLPVKYVVLKLRNLTAQDRRLSVTGYVEWVLGDMVHKNKMFVVVDKDPQTNVLFARNRYNTAFAEKIAFFDTDTAEKTFTCDRTEFIGRNGSLRNPEALSRKHLSGRAGAGIDPCTALQVPVHLAPEEEKELVFRLGAGKNEQETQELVARIKGKAYAHEARLKVHDQWNHILSAVVVSTPDDAMNIMTNGWWLYQTLACRIWGRSGFYQSGGAFGFRDQLQDVLALMHTTPEITREQLLLAASRQFKEGDVQHWWHPPTGRGVRTTCSDDYLWLPYVASRYITTTGDAAVLNEYVSFIDGRPLQPDEESYYDLPVFLNHWETLYNHCKHAIRYGLKFGQHGLPLIGSGDWNDGMDKVGEHGKGESVWLAFFLYDVLTHFAAIAENYGDTDFTILCNTEAENLKTHIHENAWDGAWYRRAYFDDGTPLGSATNEECKIDSISQSWSLLSGGGAPERSLQGMKALNEQLIDRKNKIIKLLTPPFDKSDLYPGYIKGYVPGVRENGGQYTHAAIWTIMAFAALKDKERVWELFSMVNPVNHTRSAQDVEKYKVEPYVMAADVYGAPPHEGRGGWTWYTGSAGWTYQLAIGSILGINRQGDRLYLTPCIPDEWEGYQIRYRFGNTLYHLQFKNEKKEGRVRFSENGQTSNEPFIALKDDGNEHYIEVTL
ncbi:GH36-type glycosyl hydrolase domain-containing protein [Niabella drilacis]|uniref:Cellobiose phosphorylase n=1 Tax=Niabella drilacis (strain DSM 25811 / CCM 8410 / CCUG 62505 / LMG 26954 / E90) TaxID=1285928 RepID=A0A1G7BE44_NIADE|nr:glucoamylase family protein [Niabella drilacis]SDE25252.1 Cellobiose phosphorylase [Niabella drilacis]